MRNWTFLGAATLAALFALVWALIVYTRGEETTFAAGLTIALAGNSVAAALISVVNAEKTAARRVLDWISLMALASIVYFTVIVIVRTLFNWPSAITAIVAHMASVAAMATAARRSVREGDKAEAAERERVDRRNAERSIEHKLDLVLSRTKRKNRRKRKKT